MLRSLLALSALAATAAPACAQPRKLPLSPGVRPASPIGPGTQFLPQPTPRFRSPPSGMSGSFHTTHGKTLFGPHRGFGYGGFGYLGYGYGGYGGYGYDAPQPLVIEIVPPPLPPQLPPRGVVLANEFPATLTVQFPAPADVWLNGAEVTGGPADERVLTSPVLKPGASFAFDVRARWDLGGKTYEAKRTVTLEAGARSRLIIVSGTEVK